ncbi:glycosyltransferase family 4 protein [Phyllobacterium endophyticum]|uniref:glycosyltransferase family 4 protein n=1 Tax=Phyllobacterium endophyticum TaxID=1149773 RepID=UPI0017B729BF|nr:glycosyltransferase family 4 protein [Phyllobacterium endophyticum]MBB3237654.1 glycosyltransferase involved in cell wall biosynthesis [Phyllobacterium endophyticum]
MKIVFANRYFYPDQSATSRMVSGLAIALARRGFEVTAIASRTLHDHSNVTLPAEEMVAGLKVERLWATRFGRSNIFGRIIDYITFHISAFVWCLLNLKSGDVCVVCTDPPLLSVTTALPIRWRRARMINWVMDLFPEVAMELGVLPNKSVSGSISRAMRDWSMRKSAMIVCPTAAMASYLSDRGLSDVSVMHHWSDGEEIYPVAPAANGLRTLWGLQDKFVIGYSGNFGRAHDFSTLLEAAVLLKDHDEIQFLLIGGGQRRDHVEEIVRNRELKNVVFKPLQPAENIAESLSAADAHIVSLIPRLEHCIVPSKFYGVLAAGRPTLFIGDRDGEVARVVASADCGAAVEIGEGGKLADLIVDMKNAPERRMQMGEKARRVLDTMYSRENAVSAWSEVMLRFKQQTVLTTESSAYGPAE